MAIDLESLTPEQKTRMREGERTCKACGETKHVSQFSKHLCRAKSGKVYVVFRPQCMACRALLARRERRGRTEVEHCAVQSLMAKGYTEKAILDAMDRVRARPHG